MAPVGGAMAGDTTYEGNLAITLMILAVQSDSVYDF
jgi:hypothetical protein